MIYRWCVQRSFFQVGWYSWSAVCYYIQPMNEHHCSLKTAGPALQNQLSRTCHCPPTPKCMHKASPQNNKLSHNLYLPIQHASPAHLPFSMLAQNSACALAVVKRPHQGGLLRNRKQTRLIGRVHVENRACPLVQDGVIPAVGDNKASVWIYILYVLYVLSIKVVTYFVSLSISWRLFFTHNDPRSPIEKQKAKKQNARKSRFVKLRYIYTRKNMESIRTTAVHRVVRTGCPKVSTNRDRHVISYISPLSCARVVLTWNCSFCPTTSVHPASVCPDS